MKYYVKLMVKKLDMSRIPLIVLLFFEPSLTGAKNIKFVLRVALD